MTWPPAAIDLILILFLIMGLFGTFLPVLPGPSFIIAGALLHALVTSFQPLTISHLLVLAVMALVAWGSQYLLAALGARRFGGSKKGVIGATVGGVLGLFIPIMGGMFIGAFLGGLLCELYYEQKELRQAARSGAGAVIGIIASFAAELVISLAMIFYIWRLF